MCILSIMNGNGLIGFHVDHHMSHILSQLIKHTDDLCRKPPEVNMCALKILTKLFSVQNPLHLYQSLAPDRHIDRPADQHRNYVDIWSN